MIIVLIFTIAALLLSGLLFSEQKESLKGILLTKPFLSLLFIATALLYSKDMSLYFYLITIGLVFSFAGDICLAFFFNPKVFKAGLVFFLGAHLVYVAAFFTTAQIGIKILPAVATVLFVSIIVFVQLKPGLGSMMIPVIAYIVIISLMVIGAASIAADLRFTLKARLVVFSGAVLFYVSDLFVARHRFIKKSMLNRYIGLPLYSVAQLLFAYSVSMI